MPEQEIFKTINCKQQMIIFYHFLTTLILVIFFPVIYLLKQKDNLRGLFALNLPYFRNCKTARIWVHALSVGEVLSAIPLLESLKCKYPSREIVLSVKTITGLEIAKNQLKTKVDYIVQMPLDFWWFIRKVIKNINPGIFLLIETDIWPGLITTLRKLGVKTILVNGRISPKTGQAYKRWKSLIKWVFEPFQLFLMQTNIDKYRMINGGILPEKLKVTGNIKFDKKWKNLENKDRDKLIRLFNLRNKKIWVAGSTHYPEEKIIFQVFIELIKEFSDLSLIICPREQSRFNEVFYIAGELGLNIAKKTELVRVGDFNTKNIQADKHEYNVFLLDTLGELAQVYDLAHIAFVGGSIVPRGGHNLLEPGFFGVPVVFGPYMYNFSDMAKKIIEYGGGRKVKDKSELFHVMLELLRQEGERQKMGKMAKEFVLQNQGALNKVMKIIEPFIDRC